eukprot:7313362-Pyramimonas_sp.AAC.1
MLATARRIGWQVVSASRWISHDGEELELSEGVGPRSIKGLLDRAIVRWQYAQISVHEGLEHLKDGIHLEPVRE